MSDAKELSDSDCAQDSSDIDVFTDGDFEDSDEDDNSGIKINNNSSKSVPCNEAINISVCSKDEDVQFRDKNKKNSPSSHVEMNGVHNGDSSSPPCNENELTELSIVGILGKDHDRAEARLAARRQARAEAREIRMRELERQQKEQEENADKVYDMYSDTTPRISRGANRSISNTPSANNYLSSRRSSEDSLEEMGSIRDIRLELKEVEDKFRKAMILNAQLDNDKASFSYQLELFKDKLEDLQEQYTQLQREHKDKCRAHESLSRECRATREELQRCTAALQLRDRCIREAGLELVILEDDENEIKAGNELQISAALVSSAGKQALESAGQGTLDVRLQTLHNEKQTLENEVKHLKTQLDDERSKKKNMHNSHNGPVNGSDSDSDSFEMQRENSKLVGDYKFRAQKAEQDVLTLQATVARLESQVLRYRSAAEQAERIEDELKCDRRKLQREAREALSRVEELETENSHLNKRLDKLKNAKSALLKEL